MKALSAILLLVAVLAAVVGSVANMPPMVAFTAKICLSVSIISFLVALVMGYMKEQNVNGHKKTIAH